MSDSNILLDETISYPQPMRATLTSEDENNSDMAVHLPCYRYIRYEDAENIHFPTVSNDDRNNIPVDTLVWVLLSKGKQKVPKLYKRARTLESEPDAEGRINVKYTSGSTYRVRRLRLVPVPENLSQTILVAAETNDYRRMSIVHTLKEDHFIEIGCDFGILVDSVDAKTTLGIDKSEESIQIAKERYPDQRFLLKDVFEDDLLEIFNPKESAATSSLVVSIDINGNRELPAVLNCIQVVLDAWSPRLILVKSRALHAKMTASLHSDEHKTDVTP